MRVLCSTERLVSSCNIPTYSFAVNSLAPVIRLVRFLDIAASFAGVARISMRSGLISPAVTRGSTMPEGLETRGVVTGVLETGRMVTGVLEKVEW